MTSLSDREKAFENMFAHDQEMKFKAEARANKLLGLWAAEKMGLSADEANSYAKEVVAADFEEAGHEDVFRKVRRDFDARNVSVSDEELRTQMLELAAIAIEQVKSE
ncbi:DUF1476 domain-containing protein [Pseudohoeflea coraliihabitans]|uniref:DUF1476 domain-containing protein n=1 Tax=Pseudohoeflea coraliihabitans TaxID=2860393 RepID=A0ABS6WST7_9HYPH|nr:DUF1476 domain-containing protein [Pseudohoeflea sp. DP4N28-3]MBW3098840.1 DUF1476 domain-containing protein [Pseudohoeflea sp. DP4N28-3]